MQADSFTQIYQSYFDPVYRYALSLSGSPHIAEEITQETFFKALRSLNQFQGRSSLKSWLCAIAKNLWLSEQRKRKDQPIDDAMHLSDPSAGPEEAIVRQDEHTVSDFMAHDFFNILLIAIALYALISLTWQVFLQRQKEA